jgi:hypothetical protein
MQNYNKIDAHIQSLKKHIHVVHHSPNLARITIFLFIMYFIDNNDNYVEVTQVFGTTQFGTLEIVKYNSHYFMDS